MALNSKSREILFCECKWSDRPVGVDILNALVEKSKMVDWNMGNRKEHYCLFSKSGFTEDLRREAKRRGVILIEGV